MRAVLIIAFLALEALAQPRPLFPPRFDRFLSRGEQGRTDRGLDSPGVALCDAIDASDKAGAWDCLNGDGTMAAGSATTWVATGSPTNSTENGWPVRTYTSAQNDQQPSDASFPASDFTVCQHMRFTSVAVAQLAVFGTTGAAADNVTLPFEVQGAGGNFISYVSDGTANSNFATTQSLSTGTWYFFCFTYQRVGGASNNVGRLYLNGSQIGTGSSMRLAQALSSKWTSNGYVGGSVGSAKSIRGQLITYKLLSGADIARIYARLGP